MPRLPPESGGPLVAVCGLCGGAGASTLALLIARWAARERGGQEASSPVLVIDTGSTTAGLSLYAGAESPASLTELAEELCNRRKTSRPMFVAGAHGLRLIASSPRPQPDAAPEAIARILRDARKAHSLTVADCGTVALPAQRLALELASQVVWVLPATNSAIRRAGLVLAEIPLLGAAEMIVARRERATRTARTRRLAGLAEARRAELVLMPHVSELGAGSSDAVLDACGLTLQALAAKLRQ